MRKIFAIGVLYISCVSCLADKANTSPVANFFQNTEKLNSAEIREVIGKNSYAAELSNLIAGMPKFQNKEVNEEMGRMKTHLSGYLNALATYNKFQQKRSLSGFTKSYQKVQKIRQNKKVAEDEILNTYLVKIKNNIAHLESGI